MNLFYSKACLKYSCFLQKERTDGQIPVEQANTHTQSRDCVTVLQVCDDIMEEKDRFV